MAAGDFESRLVTTFEEVGLPEHVAEQDSSTLSGGQAARVALAAILLSRFDITMLDEPTNDLDFDGLARLEHMVQRRSGALLVVSHDRAFLDRAVTDVFELDEHSRTGRLYGGGWSGYLSERAAEQSHAEEAYAVYTAQRDDFRQRAQRERQWATKGVAREKKSPRDNDKAQRDFRINRTEKQASRARRTERALATLEVVDKPWEGWELQFNINEAHRSGAVVVRLEEAVIDRGDFCLGPFTLDIGWADRVALVGPNGTGKTTLVEAILGRLPLTAGTRRMGPSVVVGELGQDRRLFRDAGTLLDAFLAAVPGLRPDLARAQLAKFGLGAEAVTRPPAVALPGRAHAGRAGRLCGQRRQPLGVGRAHEPPRPARHRAAGVGPGLLRGHPCAGVARPPTSRRSAGHTDDHPAGSRRRAPGLARGALSRSRAR